MRLFVAIDCTVVNDTLCELQKYFHPLKARFPNDFHLTLQFIGEVEESEAEAIIEKLSHIRFTPFTIQLNKMGTFTSYSQKVVWCGIQTSQKLHELQQKIVTAITDKELERKFHPHITLARIKKHQQLKSEEKEVLSEGVKKEVSSDSLKVNRFVLYESELKPSGPVYRVIREFPYGIWRDV